MLSQEGIAKSPPACSANSSITYMGSFCFTFIALLHKISYVYPLILFIITLPLKLFKKPYAMASAADSNTY